LGERGESEIALVIPFRFFVIVQKTACVHCAAKKECPNAQAMGLDK